MVGIDLAVNVIMAPTKKVVQVLAGDPNADWRPGDLVLWARDGRKPNHVGIVIDRTGRVRYRVEGFREESFRDLERVVERLLAEIG